MKRLFAKLDSALYDYDQKRKNGSHAPHEHPQTREIRLAFRRAILSGKLSTCISDDNYFGLYYYFGMRGFQHKRTKLFI